MLILTFPFCACECSERLQDVMWDFIIWEDGDKVSDLKVKDPVVVEDVEEEQEPIFEVYI